MPKHNFGVMFVIFIISLVGITIFVLNQKPPKAVKKGSAESVKPTTIPTVTMSPTPKVTNTKITVNLTGVNNTAIKGTATLEEKNSKVIVTLRVSDPTASAIVRPAHIHKGTCPNPGTIVYPLTSISGGASVTTLNTTLRQLKLQGPLAVNIHQSAQNIKVNVACGDILIK
jgi:hypothetical protein